MGQNIVVVVVFFKNSWVVAEDYRVVRPMMVACVLNMDRLSFAFSLFSKQRSVTTLCIAFRWH